MLIDFSVRNFRSIGDEVTFSLVASADALLRSNVIEDPTILGPRGPALLKSAILYGGNASGKTSFCQAVACMKRLVEESATGLNEGDPLPGIVPFRLRADLAGGPTRFEARVLLEGAVYRYGFEATRRRIEREWLYVTGAEPRSREVMLFERAGEDKAAWTFGASFRGNREFLRAQTRASNCLILSKGPQESFAQLTPLYEWFARRLKTFNMASFPAELEQAYAARCQGSDIQKGCVTAFARVADAAVQGASAEIKHFRFPQQILDSLDEADKEEALKLGATLDHHTVFLLRRQTDTGEPVRMSIEDESSGTRRFLVLAGLVAEAFRNGDTVVLDEFEASLHTLLTKDILGAINDLDIPGRAAQFILATHDTNLLDLSALRRDQVFMVEKNAGQTEIFSLYDLTPTPKTDASLERQYLADRFGGTPKLGNLRLAIADAILGGEDGERPLSAAE